MNMPVPNVSEDSGPDWAENINASLSIIDSHNHTAGQGVPITPSGINISSDLSMGSNNLTATRSVRFTAQGAPLSGGSDLGCIYESGVDLYYNDGNGNQVRITQSGSVTGASGTITGLPSGTASASFAGGTFTFQSATNTPATMAVGPIITGASIVNPKTVTISASNTQPANYSLFWPTALPGSTSFLNTDTSGNMGFTATVGSGSVVLASGVTGSGLAVLATSPTLVTPALGTPSSGNLSGCTSYPSATNSIAGTVSYEASSSYSSTFSFNGSGGGTSGSISVSYSRVGSIVTLRIPIVTATTGTSSTNLQSNSQMPSAVRPPSNVIVIIAIQVNGVVGNGFIGSMSINSDGNIQIFSDPNQSKTWSTSVANCGLGFQISSSYSVV